jgi:ABC-2 type transport system ATP-binding protein
VIRTGGLGKTYRDGTVALDGVDLEVPSGSVYGVVGPNGSGKTTLLGVLAGLRRATAGTVTIDTDPARIAVLPDTPRFDRWLTGREVVTLARDLVADPNSRRVDEVLDEAGLTDAADRQVGGYSRGMLQRVGMAATVVGDPELVLLDEPASALDPQGRREILDLIARLRGRATVLFSSHILSDVQQVCDAVGVLAAGRLIFQGPIEGLLSGSVVPAYEIRVRDDPAPLEAALAALPWVRSVDDAIPGRLAVEVESVEIAERDLAGVIAGAGVRLLSVGRIEPTLESVFLEMTR